jgi:hypothetical protein
LLVRAKSCMNFGLQICTSVKATETMKSFRLLSSNG